MRFPLLFILASLFITSNAQNRYNDTSSTCIAFWKKGETKSYLITQIKERVKEGYPEPQVSVSYNANVSILDSGSDGYKVQWVFTLSDKFKADNPHFVGLMPAFEGMKFVFLTTETGAFKELINWQDVKDTYIKMFEMSVKDKTDSTYQAGITKTKELFNSREMVEGTLIKEIVMFYSPYGYEYSTREKSVLIEMPNPFSNEEPLPGTEISRITELNPQSDYFKLITRQIIDTVGVRRLLASMYMKLDLSKEEIKQTIDELLSSMKIENLNEYQLTLSSGWLQGLKYSRSAFIGNIKQLETYSFELVE